MVPFSMILSDSQATLQGFNDRRNLAATAELFRLLDEQTVPFCKRAYMQNFLNW